MPRTHRHHPLTVVLVLVTGCALEAYLPPDDEVGTGTALRISSIEAYHQRYKTNASSWIGKNVIDLIHVMGAPDMVLHTTPKGVAPAGEMHMDSYIYMPGPDTSAHCIRAFVVVEVSGDIVNYYCR